jgi:hypothetical protein
MIRRRVQLESGEEQFWLIAQHDHAILAGQLAAAFGNSFYDSAALGEQTTFGVAMHDAGWPLHDDAPELNDEGLPSDVFETTVERGTLVWEASAARAEAGDAYAGLLVSIHVQRLAARFDQAPARLSNRERFWLIRFRNDQAQRQMRLRELLGLSVDRPLDLGLSLQNDAAAELDPAEQRLAFDVRLLQSMDLLSLCICCTQAPTNQIGPLARRIGGTLVPLHVERLTPSRLFVQPWPFAAPLLRVSFPYRAVPARAYEDAQQLREVLARSPRRSFEVMIESGGPAL